MLTPTNGLLHVLIKINVASGDNVQAYLETLTTPTLYIRIYNDINLTSTYIGVIFLKASLSAISC